MSNAYYSSREKILRLENPLLQIDSLLGEYCRDHNCVIEKNYHGIRRSLRWLSKNGFNRGIGIGLKNEDALIFRMGISAWEDRNDGRYVKYKLITEELMPPFDEHKIIVLLDQARKEVSSWTRKDLKKAYPDEGKKKK